MDEERAPRSQIAEEDATRARLYRLLARFLARAPDRSLLAFAASLTGDATDVGQALFALSRVAGSIDERAAEREYHDLFIGLGRGELVPFGSYYLTGFLHEKPLARLRDDLARLGVERAAGVSEPEDHVAAVCEVMAGLIEGAFGSGPNDERAFFHAHLAPWAERFFTDLEAAESSLLYGPIGRLGRLFMEIETTAYEMAA